MNSKAKHNDDELDEVKNEYENERRNSVAIEYTAAQLQKEHKTISDELDSIKRHIKQQEGEIKELTKNFN